MTSTEQCGARLKVKISRVADDCEKTAVVVQDGCVSSIDIVNSKSCEIQIDKNSPTLMIDKVRIFVFLAGGRQGPAAHLLALTLGLMMGSCLS